MKMEIEPLTFPGVDPKRPMIIAGPCSAESREQVLKTASELAARGVKIFRAGIWKPAPSRAASKASASKAFPG